MRRFGILGIVVTVAVTASCGRVLDDDDSGGGTSQTTCEDLNQTAAEYLAANSDCNTAADCQYADKGCYEGPEVSCVAVGLALSADLTQWLSIQDDVQAQCSDQCGGSECGATIACVDGRCTATFP